MRLSKKLIAAALSVCMIVSVPGINVRAEERSDKQREEIITETDSSAEEEKQTADEGQNEAAENTAEEEKQEQREKIKAKEKGR